MGPSRPPTRVLVDSSGLGDRITLRAADITCESLGHDRDAVLLSDVLYLNDEVSLAVLEAAHRALAPGGRLVVRGYYSDPRAGHPLWGALFDLARLLWEADRAPITRSRVRSWLERVGFGEIDVFPLTERSTCILARRSGRAH